MDTGWWDVKTQYLQDLQLTIQPYMDKINKLGNGHMYIPDKDYWEARRIMYMVNTCSDSLSKFKKPTTFGYQTPKGFVVLLPESESEKEVFV